MFAKNSSKDAFRSYTLEFGSRIVRTPLNDALYPSSIITK